MEGRLEDVFVDIFKDMVGGTENGFVLSFTLFARWAGVVVTTAVTALITIPSLVRHE